MTILQDDAATAEPIVLTIGEFCARQRMSQATFHKLLRLGIGPRVMSVGTSVRITLEAERDWQREREQAPRPRRRPAKRGA
jgi:hypothetical protein